MSPGGIDEQRQGGAELSRADGRGRTPLIHAARSGSPGAVRLLLACGSPVGRQDNKVRAVECPQSRQSSSGHLSKLWRRTSYQYPNDGSMT